MAPMTGEDEGTEVPGKVKASKSKWWYVSRRLFIRVDTAFVDKSAKCDWIRQICGERLT